MVSHTQLHIILIFCEMKYSKTLCYPVNNGGCLKKKKKLIQLALFPGTLFFPERKKQTGRHIIVFHT